MNEMKQNLGPSNFAKKPESSIIKITKFNDSYFEVAHLGRP